MSAANIPINVIIGILILVGNAANILTQLLYQQLRPTSEQIQENRFRAY